MALTLVATAGSASANSYTTVVEGNAYHEFHLYASTWNAATDERKAQALVWATSMLDTYFEWFGCVATQVQALGFPRIGAYDKQGRLLSALTIPVDLVRATAELARKMLSADRTEDEKASSGGDIKDLKVGPIEIEYVEGTSSDLPIIPDHVVAMLSHLGDYRSGIGGAVTVRRA